MNLLRKKLNILIFGYGSHGKKIKNLVRKLNSEDFIFNFIGICRSIKKDSDIELFSSLQDVKKKVVNIDCVFITTPDHSHLEIFKECVESEIPFIYVEKPAYEVERFCEDNIYHLQKKIKYIQIGYHLNYEDGFKELRKLIKNNEIGHLLRIDMFSGQGLAFKDSFKDSWRSRNNNQILQTVMSHSINYIINLNDNLELNKHISYLKKSKENGFYDTCHMSGILNNGALYSLTASWGSPLKNCIKGYFSNGFWSYDNDIGKISFEFPRDVFDERGYFIKPKLNSKKVEVNGLKNSVRYFIEKCFKNKFSKYEFNQSALTSKILNENKFLT